MRSQMKRLIPLLLISALISTASCIWSSEEKYFKTAEEAKKDRKWPTAIEYYEKVVKVAPESSSALSASQAGAKVALVYTKDPNRLVMFLRHIILYSKSEEERITSQRLLAETYFDQLNDYKNAAIELNRALDFFKSGKESAQLRLMLARAHFFKNEFFQARTEVDAALREAVDQDFVFKALLLKANIYFNEKRLDEAIALYQKLEEDFPKKSVAEQVGLNLAVCFEEKEDFKTAIEVLEKMRVDYTIPEMIDLKISRLKARLEQLPGAKGLRK